MLLGNHTPSKLPATFHLRVRDDGMEPLLTRGNLAIFSTVVKPAFGDCVLIRTSFGPEIRQFEPIKGEGWAGRALDPAYETISTADEWAVVMAVLVGVDRQALA